MPIRPLTRVFAAAALLLTAALAACEDSPARSEPASLVGVWFAMSDQRQSNDVGTPALVRTVEEWVFAPTGRYQTRYMVIDGVTGQFVGYFYAGEGTYVAATDGSLTLTEERRFAHDFASPPPTTLVLRDVTPPATLRKVYRLNGNELTLEHVCGPAALCLGPTRFTRLMID